MSLRNEFPGEDELGPTRRKSATDRLIASTVVEPMVGEGCGGWSFILFTRLDGSTVAIRVMRTVG